MKYWIPFVLFLFFSLTLFSQDKELAIWTSVESSYDISRRLFIEGKIAARSNAGINTVIRYFGEPIIGYHISPSISAIAGIRYGTLQDRRGGIQGNFTFYRLYGELRHKASLGQFRLKQRLRLQKDTEKKQSVFTESHLRLKTSLELKIREWKADPEVFIEFFKPLGNNALNGTERIRYRVQTELSVGKNNVTIAYFIDRDTPFSRPSFNSHMLGLFFDLKL